MPQAPARSATNSASMSSRLDSFGSSDTTSAPKNYALKKKVKNDGRRNRSAQRKTVNAAVVTAIAFANATGLSMH